MIKRQYYTTDQAIETYYKIANRENWDKLYNEYRNTYNEILKLRNKLQKENKKIKNELYNKKNTELEQKLLKMIYNKNKIDIELLNDMLKDAETSIEIIELYLDYDKREFLHRKYEQLKRQIFDGRSVEGIHPDGDIILPSNVEFEDVVCNRELQDMLWDMCELILSQRQKEVVYLYYWKNMTMEQIGKKIGIDKSNVSRNLQNSIEKLREHISTLEIVDYLY